ncbi:MAG: Gldg family protein [Candidatus Poribacteria bacterium]|nr:Gldg family protein [Candidatus Poribacteria bacterium]
MLKFFGRLFGRSVQRTYSVDVLLPVVLLLGILVLVNFLSSRRFLRADLTEDKRYTVSKATKNVIKSLDDIVTITVYFSTEPADVARIRRDVRDVLDEYEAFSQKLQIDFIDPADFDDAQKQELRFKGIPEVQVNVPGEDKLEIANVYMAISVGYGGKEEVLPIVRSTSNLEYELTSTILKVTTKEAKTVGFLTGHDEFDINAQTQGHQQFRGLLDKNAQGQYNLTTVDLRSGEPVDQSITTLVVAGPKQELTDREKYEIDQFIMRGGRTIFLIDPVTMPPGTVQATPLSTGLNDLLEHYGIKLGNNVLADLRFHDSVRMDRGIMRLIQPYPYFVKIAKANFSKEHAVTSQLEVLTLPWTSSLETLDKESIKATPLAKTSEFGRSSQGFYNLDPNFPIPQTDLQAYTVAAALEGKFKSFYADKEIPAVASTADTDTENGNDTPTPAQDEEERTTITESAETQIVVVGTAQFITQLSPNGIEFFLNSIDWLTLGETLIGIRSHAITDRPLNEEVSSFAKNFIKYLCTIGIPLLIVIFGLIRYFLKRRVKRLVGAYGSPL